MPVVVLAIRFDFFIDLIHPDTPAFDRLIVVLLVLFLFAGGLYEVVKSWLRTHRPPVIRISTAGFQYRGKTIPLRSIEDVARAPRAVCRVVSDARIVEVERDFCEPSEREWLRHEIRRLVIEAGG